MIAITISEHAWLEQALPLHLVLLIRGKFRNPTESQGKCPAGLPSLVAATAARQCVARPL
jgi:hypothetical protein